MPTVLSLDGLRVAIYPNDHRPAHVHVIGAGVEAVFDLRCPQGPPVLRESHGFRGPGQSGGAAAGGGTRSALRALEADPWR